MPNYYNKLSIDKKQIEILMIAFKLPNFGIQRFVNTHTIFKGLQISKTIANILFFLKEVPILQILNDKINYLK